MPIQQVTPMQAVASFLEKEIEKKEKALINALAYVGESCLAEMRSNYNYQDQTGNLTSSKGYVLAVDGKVIKASSFDTVKSGAQGAATGEAFLRRIAGQFPRGIVLVVGAGMKYAFELSAKGYNVIDSAETMAARLVPVILKQLGFVKR
jgi:hypothetical protein